MHAPQWRSVAEAHTQCTVHCALVLAQDAVHCVSLRQPPRQVQEGRGIEACRGGGVSNRRPVSSDGGTPPATRARTTACRQQPSADHNHHSRARPCREGQQGGPPRRCERLPACRVSRPGRAEATAARTALTLAAFHSPFGGARVEQSARPTATEESRPEPALEGRVPGRRLDLPWAAWHERIAT